MMKFTKSIKDLFLRTGIMLALLVFSVNAKAQWTLTPLLGYDIICFATSGSNIYAGTDGNGVYLSTNAGTSWNAINNGLPPSATPYIYSLAATGSNVFAGTQGLGIYFSSNNGTSWTAVNNGPIAVNASVYSIAISGSNVFAATDGGVFISSNNGTTWKMVNSNTAVSSLVISGSNIYAGVNEDSVYLSANNGATWKAVCSGLPAYSIDNIMLAASGSDVFLATCGNNHGVYFSGNNGTTWNAADNGRLNGNQAYSVLINGSDIYAGGYGNVYYSTNNGTTWTTIDSGGGLPSNGTVLSLAISGGYLFAGVGGPFDAGPWIYPLNKVIGINELRTEENSISSYPNPSNGKIIINNTNMQSSIVNFGLEVYNVTGEKIYFQSSIPNFPYSIDLSSNPPGIYLYRVLSAEGEFIANGKLIIQ